MYGCMDSKSNATPSQVWSFCWKNKDNVRWVALLGFQVSKIKKRMREVGEQIQEFSVIWTEETPRNDKVGDM